MRLIRQLLAAARQRVEDAAREVRIRNLVAAEKAEYRAGRVGLAVEAWMALKAEINARSPQQIARMERRQGLRK